MEEPPAYPQPPAYQHPPRYDESWTPETEAHVIYRRPPGRVVVEVRRFDVPPLPTARDVPLLHGGELVWGHRDPNRRT